jgi:hypothetical protein
MAAMIHNGLIGDLFVGIRVEWDSGGKRWCGNFKQVAGPEFVVHTDRGTETTVLIENVRAVNEPIEKNLKSCYVIERLVSLSHKLVAGPGWADLGYKHTIPVELTGNMRVDRAHWRTFYEVKFPNKSVMWVLDDCVGNGEPPSTGWDGYKTRPALYETED